MNINIVYIGYCTIYIQSLPSVFVILFSGKISPASLGAPNKTNACDVALSLQKKRKILESIHIEEQKTHMGHGEKF